MAIFNNKKLINLVLLVIFATLILGFFCTEVFDHEQIHNTYSDSPNSVLKNIQQECCTNGISKYINQWKNVSAPLPYGVRDGIILILFGFIIAFTIRHFRFCNDLSNNDLICHNLGILNNTNLVIFNYLKLAFARGILNPKIY